VDVPPEYRLPIGYYLEGGYLKTPDRTEPVLGLIFEGDEVTINDVEIEDLLLWVWAAYLAQREIADHEFTSILGSSRAEVDSAVCMVVGQLS
jgi:hypothetical protein